MHALCELAGDIRRRLVRGGEGGRTSREHDPVPVLGPRLPDVRPAGGMVGAGPIDIGLVEHWLDEWRYSMDAHRPAQEMVVNDAPWRDARRAVNEDYEGAVEDQRTAHIVEALDACIDSLELHHRAAVWRAYGQLSVFPFARMDFLTTLAEAKRLLGVMMRGRGFPC